MAYITPERNLEGVPWQGLREAADLAYFEMDDEVSAAYYDYWRHGETFPWGPFDTKGDPVADKLQFDQLTEMTQCMHFVMFHKINHKMHQDDPNDPRVIPQDEYRYEGEEDMVQKSKNRMATLAPELGTSPKQMMDHYRKRTKELAGYDFPDWTIE